MKSVNKIAILTSGGDAPGMNPAIVYVVEEALKNGLETYIVYEGYKGLYENNIKEIKDVKDLGDIENQGGTSIYTARFPEFKEEETRIKAKENLDALGIDALVVIGGDGSFMGAKLLSDLGVNTVGIPGTIDNDIRSTEFTLGFFTAVETLNDIILKVRDTAESHNRLFVIEGYGHGAGDLPLWSGLEAGADIISIPENKLEMADIIEKADALRKGGQRSIIILVAEFLYNSNELANKIQETTGIESKAIIPLQIQRGGVPAQKDKDLAKVLGTYAVQELLAGKSAITVGVKGKEWTPYSTDIMEAVDIEKPNYDKLLEIYKREHGE